MGLKECCIEYEVHVKCNTGKDREMGKVRKNMSENAEKLPLSLQTPCSYKTHPV